MRIKVTAESSLLSSVGDGQAFFCFTCGSCGQYEELSRSEPAWDSTSSDHMSSADNPEWCNL